jgi:hypothetical protein
MKHLMRYEGYSSQERLNDILDKISTYGINTLSIDEKEFLDAHSNNKETEVHNKLIFKENETVFEDDYGLFKFEHLETIEFDDEIHYIGTLYVPELKKSNGSSIKGILIGKIVVYKSDNDEVSVIDFETENGIDVFEFCNGIEYELDNFIDYVVNELKEKM